MIDVLTYTVYLTLLLILLVLTYEPAFRRVYVIEFKHDSKLNKRNIMALFLISILVGFRDNVGTDWGSYVREFYTFVQDPDLSISDHYFEYGFFFLNKWVAAIGLGYQWVFLIVAFISWYFIFKSVPKILLPLYILFLFLDEYFFSSMNGVRQFVAISIWLASIRFIVSREFIKFILLLIFASLFHKSVLFLIPLYFLPYSKFNRKTIWIVLFVITLFVGSSSSFVGLVKSSLIFMEASFGGLVSYGQYLESDHLSVNEGVNLGLGFYFKVIINFIIILLSTEIIKHHPQSSIYYALFFIGSLFFNLSYNILALGRINAYFLIIKCIVLAVTVLHFWTFNKYKLIIILFIISNFVVFLSAIYNSSNLSNPYNISF